MARAFKLTNDMLILSTEAPGGIYNAAQLKKIAALCDSEGVIVKATEDQRLALFVPVEKAQALAQQLQGVGIGIRHYQDGLHQPTNCIGALCADHQQDAMSAALEVTESLAKTTLANACKIGINGCSRCCVPTHTLDISVVGDTNGYRISLGGKTSQLPEMATFMAEGVPAAELPKLLNKVVSIYKSLAQADESLQDVMERCGSKAFVDALTPYSQDAHHSDDPFEVDAHDSSAAEAEVTEASESEDDDKDDVMLTAEDVASVGGDDLSAFGEDDDSDTADPGRTTNDMNSNTSDDEFDAFDADLDPKGQLNTGPNSGLDINPQDFGEAELLDEDVAINDINSSKPASQGSASEFDELSLEEDFEQFSPEDEELHSDSAAQSALAADELSDLAIEAAVAVEAPQDAVATEGSKAKTSAAPTSASAPDCADEFSAEEVTEDEADAFEAKLTESIAEEESSPLEEDINAGARLETMELVESASDDELINIAEPEALGGSTTASDFEDLEIGGFDELAAHDDGDDELSLIESDVDFSDEDLAKAEAAVAAQQAAAIGPSPVNTANTANATAAADASRSFSKPTSQTAFSGFDFDSDGRCLLRFESGAEISIDPMSIAPGQRRQIAAYGQKITIMQTPTGLRIDVDGVALTVPRRAA